MQHGFLKEAVFKVEKQGRFIGELMTCVVCGAQERSNPAVESQWRGLEVDDYSFYACPKEFPPNGAEKQEFKTAYQLVLACCLNEILKAKGKEPEPEVESYRLQRILRRERSKTSKGFG